MHLVQLIKSTSSWVALVAALALSTAAIFAQGNLGFLRNAPVGRFTSEDWDLLMETARTVLDDASAPSERSWENKKNGHRGTVRALQSFRSEQGRDCKRIQIDSFAEGLEGSSRYNVCRDENGAWKHDPDAIAPRSASAAPKP